MALSSDARQRKGQIAGLDVWLARDRERPYGRDRVLILPDRQDVPGAPGKILLDPDRRLWHIDSWKAGEGEDLWRAERDAYDESTNVRPKRVGDGLVLGADSATTQLSTGGDYAEADRLIVAHDDLYTFYLGGIAKWHKTNENWVALTDNPTTSEVTRAAANTVSGTKYIYTGKTAGTLSKYDVTGDSWSTHVTAGTWSTHAVPVMFEGVLYCLNAGSLYTVDQSVTSTVTKIYDETQSFTTFQGTLWHWTGLTTGPVGPIWPIRYEDGTTRLHEYNHFTQTHRVVAELPPNVWPFSTFHAFGFTFVAYRQADHPTLEGEAHIFYVGQGISGVAGPVREFGSATADTNIVIAGTLGDDLIFVYNDIVWAYNLTNGGFSYIGLNAAGIAGEQAVLVGFDLFYAGMTDSGEKCERWELDSYATTGSLDSGRYDMGYPGVDKILTKVTVTAEPLPADVTVQLAYSVEGGSFTTHADTWSTDGETSHTFTISSTSASVVGRDFELRIILNSTDSTKTPTIRSITAEAVSAEKRLQWQLELDAGSYESGERATSSVLSDLDTIAGTTDIVTFSDPWQVDEFTAPETYAVRIVLANTPETGAESEAWGTVILRQL